MGGPHSPGESNLSLESELQAWLEEFQSLEHLDPDLERVRVRQKLALVKDLRSVGNGLMPRLKSQKEPPTDSWSLQFLEQFPKLDGIESDLRSLLVGSNHRDPRTLTTAISPKKTSEEPIPDVLRLITSKGTTDGLLGVIFGSLLLLGGLLTLMLMILGFNTPYTTKQLGPNQTLLYYSSDTLPAIGLPQYTDATKISEQELSQKKLEFGLLPLVLLIIGGIVLRLYSRLASAEAIELRGRDLSIQHTFGIQTTEQAYLLPAGARAKLGIANPTVEEYSTARLDSIEIPVRGFTTVKIAYGASDEELQEFLTKINHYLDVHG